MGANLGLLFWKEALSDIDKTLLGIFVPKRQQARGRYRELPK
jgi:hypothetical protein